MSVEAPERHEQPAVQAPPYELLGRPIGGPGALTRDWRRFWHLTFNIAYTNWKLRFFDSMLGYLWQLVRPLLLFLVLYVFFTKIAKIGANQGPSGKFDGTQLLGAIVLFTFFAEATNGAIRSVVENEALVRKIQFPRMAIPLSVVLMSCFNLSLNLIVVMIFALAEGVRPMLTWFEVPLIVALLVVLCTGIAMMLSALFVYLRDIDPIWEVLNQVIFYASPIIIPITKVQEHISHTLLRLYMLNPLAVAFQQFKHAFVNHATPSAARLMGGTIESIVEPTIIVLVIFALGFWTFNRIAPHVAEDL